jgi:WD40 repeat protein
MDSFTEQHAMQIDSVAYSPDDALIATIAARDGSIRRCDAITGALKRKIICSVRHYTPAAIFRTTRRSQPSCGNGIQLWNIAAGTAKRSLDLHCDSLMLLAVSLDGTTFASAFRDGTVQL